MPTIRIAGAIEMHVSNMTEAEAGEVLALTQFFGSPASWTNNGRDVVCYFVSFEKFEEFRRLPALSGPYEEYRPLADLGEKTGETN